MRYFILILLLINLIAINNVFARKYDNDDDDDQPITKRRNERLKQTEDSTIQRRQRSDVSTKNSKFSTKFDKTDLDTDKRRSVKKNYDDERESNRKLFHTREEKRPEPRKGNIRGETGKYSKQEERRAPRVTVTRRQKDVKTQQSRQPIRQGGRKSAKHIPDDTDEDDDDTDEDDDDTDEDEDDTDEDNDETDEDDDDDDTDEDDDDTDEDNDDTDEDDDDTDENDDETDEDDDDDDDNDDTDEDDDSFEMITYKDKKKPTFLQRLKGRKDEKPKKQLSYRKKVYRELGLVDEGKHVSSEEVSIRPKKYNKKHVRDCDSMEEYCP